MLLRTTILLCLSFIASIARASIAPSLFFTPENQIEGMSTSISCYSSEHHWWKTVHKLKFQSVNNTRINYEVTRDCDSDELRVTADNTEGRITTLTNGFTGLNWIELTAADMQFYKCSLTICEPSEVLDSTEDKLLIVTTKPNLPKMLLPAALAVTVPENEPWNISFACSGNTGYPNGFLGLEMIDKYTPINNGPVLINTTESDEFGNAELLLDYEGTFGRQNPNDTLFRCKNYNSKFSSLVEYSQSVTLNVEYAPDKALMSSNNAQEQLVHDGAREFRLNTQFPVAVDVACFTDANPPTTNKFTQLSGPTSGVEYLHETSTVRINYGTSLNMSSLIVRFECNANYASTVKADIRSTVHAYLTVEVNGYKTYAVTHITTDGSHMNLPSLALIAFLFCLLTKVSSFFD